MPFWCLYYKIFGGFSRFDWVGILRFRQHLHLTRQQYIVFPFRPTLPHLRRNLHHLPHPRIRYARVIGKQIVIHPILNHQRLLDRVVRAGYYCVEDGGHNKNGFLKNLFTTIRYFFEFVYKPTQFRISIISFSFLFI